MGRAEVGGPIIRPGRPKKEDCNKDTLTLLLNLYREEREARIIGQKKREEIEKNIFEKLDAITARNAEVNELYQDVKKFMGLWKKYGRPMVWFVSFFGGACIIVFKLWRLIFPK